MKTSRLFAVLLMLLTCNLALAGNYILVIDGQEYEVDLDEQANIKLADGKALNVTLKKKPMLTYKTDLYSFDHPNQVTPTRQDLGEGIFQMMMSSAQGTVIIVQDYSTMDPSGMIDLMLDELTREEKQAGYKYLDTPLTKKLVNETQAVGKQSIAAFDGKQMTRQVLSVSGKDKGLLVITMLDKEAPESDRKMLADFWSSLKPNLK